MKRFWEWLARWGKWLAIAGAVMLGLRKLHKAEKALDRAEDRIRDMQVDAIENDFDQIEDRTSDFLDKQRKAEDIAGELNAPLDKIAESSANAGAVIDRWNARNRLRK